MREAAVSQTWSELSRGGSRRGRYRFDVEGGSLARKGIVSVDELQQDWGVRVEHIPSVVVIAVDVEDLLPLNTQHARRPPLLATKLLRRSRSSRKPYPDRMHSVKPIQHARPQLAMWKLRDGGASATPPPPFLTMRGSSGSYSGGTYRCPAPRRRIPSRSRPLWRGG